MTKSQAQQILSVPKFGDPDCIQALNRLREEASRQRLKKMLIGRYVSCGACGGTGDRCNVCEPDGTLKITAQLADSWDIETMLEVAEEIELMDKDELSEIGYAHLKGK